MTKEKLSFFEKQQTRRDFLKFAGKSVGGMVVSLSVLNLLGCEPQEQALAFALPEGMLYADPTKCTGCQRCETICTAFNDGKVQPFISRIHVSNSYNFGPDGVQYNYQNAPGQFGNLRMTPQTCKQCREPFCGRVCPVQAITSDSRFRNARVVDKEKCIGCGACVEACPWHMPRLDAETKKSSKCISCGMCAQNCPTKALQIIPWEDVRVAMEARGHRF